MSTTKTYTISIDVQGDIDFRALLERKIKQLLNKTTSNLFNIKRQWASFFINHFLQHLKQQKDQSSQRIVAQLERIQSRKASKQQKFNQSDVVSIMQREKNKGDFRNKFNNWLKTQAQQKIEQTRKIKSSHKDIYKKLIPNIRRQLRKRYPFKKFMRVPQMSNYYIAVQEQTQRGNPSQSQPFQELENTDEYLVIDK